VLGDSGASSPKSSGMGAQFFAAWLADQCACPLSPVLLRVGAPRPCFSNPPRCVPWILSPSKSQTPATNADFFRPSVPNPPKAILLFPNENFSIFPGDQVLFQAPNAPSARIAEIDTETTRRRNSPRLGFIGRELHPPVDCFPPTVAAFPSIAAPSTAPHRTSPHLPPSCD
jgi:hypothetical protein